MSSTTLTSVPQSRLARQAERPQRTVSSKTSRVFESQLVSALQGSRGAVAGAGATVAGRQMVAVSAGVRQNSATASSGRLRDDPVRTQVTNTPVPLTPFTAAAAAATRPATPVAAVTAPVAASTAPAAATRPATPISPGTGQAAASTAPADSTPPAAATTPVSLALTPPAVAMSVLGEALRKVGIEPSSLNLYFEETTVGYPGGSYTCRYITCELPNGNKESYDVGLMMKNPEVTAFEIRRQMGYRA
jgi:hypothetical protein